MESVRIFIPIQLDIGTVNRRSNGLIIIVYYIWYYYNVSSLGKLFGAFFKDFRSDPQLDEDVIFFLIFYTDFFYTECVKSRSFCPICYN